MNHTLPSLVEQGYEVVKENDIKEVGKQLVHVYDNLMKQPQYALKRKSVLKPYIISNLR